MSWIIDGIIASSNGTSWTYKDYPEWSYECTKSIGSKDYYQPPREPDLTKLKEAVVEYDRIREAQTRRITKETMATTTTTRVLVEYQFRVLYLGPETPQFGRKVICFTDIIEGDHNADFKTLTIMKHSHDISEKAKNWNLPVEDLYIEFSEVKRWGIKEKKKD